MTDDIQHELGELSGTIRALSGNIETWRKEQRDDINKIFKKIDELPETCLTGKQHSREIEMLKSRPTKTIGIAAALVSILSMISSTIWGVIIFLRGH
jgi:uncharacterized membrane protein